MIYYMSNIGTQGTIKEKQCQDGQGDAHENMRCITY